MSLFKYNITDWYKVQPTDIDKEYKITNEEILKRFHKCEIDTLNEHIKTLNKIIVELKSKLSKDSSKENSKEESKKEISDVEYIDYDFDVEGMDVYSIEYEYDKQQILICYYLYSGKKKELFEWTTRSSLEQYHNMLERFRKKIK